MPDPMPPPAARARAAGRHLRGIPSAILMAALVAMVTACGLAPSASPSATTEPSTPASGPPTVQPSPTATTRPTPTPEPSLSLDLPGADDERQVRVQITPEVPADGDGRLVVIVTNLSDSRVAELVLRWPTELRDTIFLAPFEPSEQRVANGGPPLLQDWSKWVEGPGERGEPAGTTSLGWGPLDPGATLTIPVLATRRAAGPVGFDLQLLAGEAILRLEDGTPAELRVELP